MNALDAKLTEEDLSEDNHGDWEMDTTDPLSPEFISPGGRWCQRFWDTTIGTLAYILAVSFGDKPAKRTDFIPSYREYREEMDHISKNWRAYRELVESFI